MYDLQRRGSDCEGHGSPSKCIESMPVEIQRHIMFCLPSLRSLGALIRSSPILYSVFRSEPKKFISNCLFVVLGDTFVDARTAQAAMQDGFQRQRRDAMNLRREPSMIWPFLESYRREADLLPHKTLVNSMSLQEVNQVATFQVSMIEPMVEEYSTWALANVGSSVECLPLSSSERMRIQRGMYRFQILCDVFGNRLKDLNISRNRPRHLRCLRFLSSYEPWEIEEILCINTFFESQYEKKLSEVSVDLHPSSQRFQGQSDIGDPANAFDLGNSRALKTLTGVAVNCTDKLDRHQGQLSQFPREPRHPTSGIGAAHPNTR